MILSNNFYRAWFDLLSEVIDLGRVVKPRGLTCRELIHTQLVVTDLRNNILVHPVRDLNYRFMVAEWLFIQAGREDVATLDQYNKQIKRFSDDGVIYNGAYGPRLANQWSYVINNLRKDPDSRQAVMTIFGARDQEKITKDVACTLSLQVLLRDGKLHGIVTMRSNDLWLGLPYDFYNFSQVVNFLAGVLHVEPGSMTIQAGSSHLYETDFGKVRMILGDKLICEGYCARSPKIDGFFDAEMALRLAEQSQIDYVNSSAVNYAHVLRSPNKAVALERLKALVDKERLD